MKMLITSLLMASWLALPSPLYSDNPLNDPFLFTPSRGLNPTDVEARGNDFDIDTPIVDVDAYLHPSFDTQLFAKKYLHWNGSQTLESVATNITTNPDNIHLNSLNDNTLYALNTFTEPSFPGGPTELACFPYGEGAFFAALDGLSGWDTDSLLSEVDFPSTANGRVVALFGLSDLLPSALALGPDMEEPAWVEALAGRISPEVFGDLLGFYSHAGHEWVATAIDALLDIPSQDVSDLLANILAAQAVPVPEPSTYLLLATLLVLTFVLQRRKARQASLR